MKIPWTGFVLLWFLLCVCALGHAQKAAEGGAGDVPRVADLQLRFEIRPEVTAKEYHNRTEYEYRLNENLYMIRSEPEKGSPYYLVDTVGSGELEYRRNAAQMDMQVPAWVLHRW